MIIDVHNKERAKVGTIEVPDRIFAATWKPTVVHQVLIADMANSRDPWSHVKGRGEVRGGGRKPWRQKGTGRARHGSIRSPLWRHGGKAHAPTAERSYEQKVNKKMRRAALLSSLSRKLRDAELIVFDRLVPDVPKTKVLAETLRTAGIKPKRNKNLDVLIVPARENRVALSRAAANLPKTKVLDPLSLNVYDIMNYKHLFVEQDAMPDIVKRYQ